VAEVERDKTAPPDGADEGLANQVPDSTLGCVAYFGWALISAAVGIALIESGPFGVARVLFAFGVAIVMACLPLVWAKGWTDE
jgi:uncharacterized membrane protein YtjA (UPF0391 family)